MSLRLEAVGLPDAVAAIRDGAAAVSSATTSTVQLAARQAGAEAARYTAEKYNLEQDVVERYVLVEHSKVNSTVTLKIRAVPIEDFNPQVKMKKFTFTDSRGRHVSRELPAIYYTRMRGGTAKFLRPAFPLTTRISGGLNPRDVIRRRIGKARDRLTRIRFYTFPSKYLKGDLVPHLQETIGDVAQVSFSGSFRKNFTRKYDGKTIRRLHQSW